MKPPEPLTLRGGALHLSGAPLEALARRHGTPLYVYSLDLVLDRLARLRAAFRTFDPLVCYAMKANDNPALLKTLAGAGAGVEVVSGGELWLARRAGFPGRRTLFSGVGKTRRELAEGLKAGVLLFNVESLGELAELEREATRLRRPAPVAFRVNPDIDAGTHRHISTGRKEDKFGLSAREALSGWTRAGRSRWLRPLGLHLHIGSQILSPEPYARAARALAALARRAREAGPPAFFLDLGGGMGVPHGDGRGLDLAAVALAAEPLKGLGRLILEPGRYLVAEAGVLVARTLHLKRAGRKRLVVLDAGMNDLLRPALYDAEHPLLPVRPRRGRALPHELVGPVCESADRFGLVRCPEPRPGDLWAIGTAGAYGYSMGSTYNGRPRPAEVVVRGGRTALARRRGSYRDLL